MSIAFTRRSGAVRNVFPSLRHLESSLRSQSISLRSLPRGGHEQSTVAVVFGREESGLSQEELALCSLRCSIAASESCGSLNLSHAVAVVLSQLYELQTEGSFPVPFLEDSDLCTAQTRSVSTRRVFLLHCLSTNCCLSVCVARVHVEGRCGGHSNARLAELCTCSAMGGHTCDCFTCRETYPAQIEALVRVVLLLE